MPIEVGGKSIETDEEGYLVDLSQWDEEIAQKLAESEGLEMTSDRWEIVNFLREYYQE